MMFAFRFLPCLTMRGKLRHLGVGAACLLSLAVGLASSPRKAAAQATGPAAPAVVERHFKGIIKQVDGARHSFTMENKLTGFSVTVGVDQASSITLKRQVEIDNLPEGQWVTFHAGQVDPAARIIRGLDQVEVLTMPPASLDAANLVKPDAVTGRLTRQRINFSGYAGKDLLSISKDARYELIVGSDAWRPEVEDDVRLCRRPNVFVTGMGTWADLQSGREIDVRYAEDRGRCVLEQCEVSDLFQGIHPYYINKPAGPSGVSAADLQAKVAAAKAIHAKIAKDLEQLMPVTMTVTPELALAGEPVTLTMEVVADHEPNPTLVAYPEYLKTAMKTQEELRLSWQVAGTRNGHNIYQAQLGLPADRKGQHLVRWTCDAGGDIKEFWRSYAIIDQGYAVCLLNVLSSPCEPFHQAHLPIDTWELKPLELDTWQHEANPEAWASISRDYRQYGDNPGFYSLYAPWNSYQMREDPPEVQRGVLAALQKLAPMLGFPGGVDNFAEYTLGTRTVQIARELGYKTVHSLCTEHHMDGVFGFNNFGKPERPYFISREDFRKTGDGGKDGMVGFPQLDRHIELARSYSNAYNPEEACMQILDRQNAQITQDPPVFMSRVLDHMEGNFQNRLSQRVPYFLSFDFQFANYEPKLVACDKVMLDFLLDKARTEPVAFSTYGAVTDFYRRHYAATPETTSYYHDYYAGMTAYDKPHLFPDVMAIENSRFMSIHVAGEILPDSLYDYTTRWDYPDWGNERISRARHVLGDFQRGMHDKFAVTPRIVDIRGMRATRQDRDADGAYSVRVTVQSDRDKDNLPLALWNIPREWRSGDGWWTVEGAGRFVPVRAPYTGNLNGLLIANVRRGKNTITVRFKTPAREPESLDFHVGPHIKGKLLERAGQGVAYLWPTYPWETELTIDLPAGRAVRCYISPRSETINGQAGRNTFRIPAGESMRVIGLNKDELQRFCHTSGPLPLSGQAPSGGGDATGNRAEPQG